MAFRLRRTDCLTLQFLADYRILNIRQLSAVFRKDKQTISRRMGDLCKAGLVKVTPQNFGRNRGRPEFLLSVSEKGFGILKQKKLITDKVPYENTGPIGSNLLDHQLLLNWFRIYLNEIDKLGLNLTLQFLACNSPFVPCWGDGHVIITDLTSIGLKTVRKVKFIPDAVFALTNDTRDKSMLFFLEVDCGTETLSSPQRDMSDIRQKILNYQWYFQSLRYKRYEAIFKVAHFQGFRVLFLSKTDGRLAALCKLTQEMEPSDFVWLTEQNRLFSDGVFWNIWARGGDLYKSPQSILGRISRRLPLP